MLLLVECIMLLLVLVPTNAAIVDDPCPLDADFNGN